MRIDRFDLLAYGKFTDKSLDLSEGSPGLHLLYGDNEAGKSTSLRALIAWLFGIPARTQDNFFHPNPQLRLGGKLRLSDGRELEFVRRKGTKGTMLQPGSEEVLEDSLLSSFLPRGMDATLFGKLYGIDHTRLLAGGQELLDQSGDLGQALFSAAVGTSGLRDIVSELLQNAEVLFKPRASTKVVNQALAQYKDAVKRVKDTSLPVKEWKELHKDLHATLAAIEDVEKARSVKSKEKSRLERLGRVKGALAQRRAVASRLGEQGGVLLLSEDFDDKRKAATIQLQTAGQAREKAEKQLFSLRKEEGSLNVRTELLENEEAILALYKDLGAVEKTRKDRPQQDGQRRLLRNEAKILLKSVRPDIGLEDANILRPLLNNKKWIAQLAQNYSLLQQKMDKAETTLRDVEDEEKAVCKMLGELTVSQLDLGELQATIAAARKAGDLESRLSEAKQRAVGELALCEVEFRRLGMFSGTLEELSRVSMPLSETLDTFEKSLDNYADRFRECGRRYKELNEEKKQAEQELKALLLQSQVPTMAQLEESRLVRERGWGLIKAKYVEGRDMEPDIAVFSGDTDLPSLYEHHVEAADHVSDTLRMDADLVAKRANLESRIEDLLVRIGDLEKEMRGVGEAGDARQIQWQGVWQAVGIDPGTPREMKQWLLRAEKLLAHFQMAHDVGADACKIQEECDRHTKAITHQIALFDPKVDSSKMSLETALTLCEHRGTQEEDIRTKKQDLERSVAGIKIRRNRTRDEVAAITTAKATWQQEWSQALDGLGLAPDVHPEHATETFDQLVTFFATFDQSDALRRRIYGMELVEKEFNEKVFGLADRLEYVRGNTDATTLAAQLNTDLRTTRESRASLMKIKGHEKDILEEIENRGITIKACQDQLAILRGQAGVATDEELEEAGERSRNKRELHKQLEALEQELTRNGDGLSISELEQEFEAADIDALEDDLEKISLDLAEDQTARDTLRDRRQTIQNEITAKDGSAAAAQASEDSEQQLATIVAGVEKYLRLQIAMRILDQRIEEYRKKNQAPLLARAGELFSRLTMGSYGNLRDELDSSGKPILLGIRPNNDEVFIEGMSEGSRDQLYLALRIATLEQHLSKGEPMPFVVDDILIGFDDNRTRVCLEVLAELATHTQVLLFTHHRRVLELSEGIEGKGGVYVHYLA